MSAARLNSRRPGYPEAMEKRRRDMGHAAEEIEQLFADLWEVFPFSRGMRRSYRPEVDVYRTEGPPSLTVLVELPGVDPRQVTVAEDVDPEQATATYERGFLTIKLPIAPEPAPAERISIVVTSSS